MMKDYEHIDPFCDKCEESKDSGEVVIICLDCLYKFGMELVNEAIDKLKEES